MVGMLYSSFNDFLLQRFTVLNHPSSSSQSKTFIMRGGAVLAALTVLVSTGTSSEGEYLYTLERISAAY